MGQETLIDPPISETESSTGDYFSLSVFGLRSSAGRSACLRWWTVLAQNCSNIFRFVRRRSTDNGRYRAIVTLLALG